jgi:hypothetical protein
MRLAEDPCERGHHKEDLPYNPDSALQEKGSNRAAIDRSAGTPRAHRAGVLSAESKVSDDSSCVFRTLAAIMGWPGPVSRGAVSFAVGCGKMLLIGALDR